MKGYPNWFSPFYKPSEPQPPSEEVMDFEKLGSLTLYDGSSMPVPVPPEGTTHIAVNRDYNEDYNYILVFSKMGTKKNPRYKELYEYYKERLAEWKDTVKEWDECKVRYDKELAETTEKNERAQLKKLKKKYPEE